MPTLFLLCGLPASGKTTLAKQLEGRRGALRLSPDEWIASLHGPDVQERDPATFDAARGRVEALQRELAGQALALGLDVILENGFWARLARRNMNPPPGNFRVREDELDLWLSHFEAPTAAELSDNGA